MKHLFEQYLAHTPIIAILRGITPDNCIPISKIIYEAGIRIIEVPLNSPEPLTSIQLLAQYFQNKAIIGAGTVLTDKQVEQVYTAGGKLIVSPNLSLAVGKEAKKLNMLWLPGVATPTEGFTALQHQADGLKIFPAENLSPQVIKAWKAVFPTETKLIPVGGIDHHNINDFLIYSQAVGLGGSIFQKGDTIQLVEQKVQTLIDSLKSRNRNR